MRSLLKLGKGQSIVKYIRSKKDFAKDPDYHNPALIEIMHYADDPRRITITPPSNVRVEFEEMPIHSTRGLVVWQRAEDTNLIGDQIDTWEDKIGLGYAFVYDSGDRANYETDGMYANFVADERYELYDESLGGGVHGCGKTELFTDSSNTFSVICGIKVREYSGALNGKILSRYNTAESEYIFSLGIASGDPPVLEVILRDEIYNTIEIDKQLEYEMVGITWDGNTCSMITTSDKLETGIVGTTPNSNDIIYLGDPDGLANYGVSELMIYDEPLSEENIDSIFRMLIRRHTIQEKPLFSHLSGIYYEPITVSIVRIPSGATVRYTLNGTEPTYSSTLYDSSNHIVITENEDTVANNTILTARNFKTGWFPGGINIAVYSLKLPAPIFDPSGDFDSSTVFWVTITADYADEIYYTTDGSVPDETKTLYTGTWIEIYPPITQLRAIAYKTDDSWVESNITTANYSFYVATPWFSPPAGSYHNAQQVYITCATASANIYYTTDGSPPDSGSTLYSGPINISTTTTIKAIGILAGWADSAIATAQYNIGPPPGA